MTEFENLLNSLLDQNPKYSREVILGKIKEKKDKIGAGYLTDQGALFLIASDLGTSLSNPLSKIEQLIEEGNTSEALFLVNKALSRNEGDARAWFYKGLILDEMENFGSALNAYGKSSALNPERIEVWSNMGEIQHELGLYEDSLISLNKALSLDSELVSVLITKADLLAHLDKDKEALEIIVRVLKMKLEDEERAEAKFIQCGILTKLEKYEAALAIIDDLSYINPEDVDYIIARSMILLSQEKIVEAKTEAEIAIDIEGGYNADAWIICAESQLLLGKWEEALPTIDKAIKIEPGNADAWFLKARILATNQKDEEAIDALTVAISIDESSKEQAKEDPKEFMMIKTNPRFCRIIK